MLGEGKFGFFCELYGTYQFGKSKTVDKTGTIQSVTTNGNITGFDLGLRPGILYFITPKIAIEGMFSNLAYSSRRDVISSGGQKINTQISNGMGLSFGSNALYLGVNFYLGGKK